MVKAKKKESKAKAITVTTTEEIEYILGLIDTINEDIKALRHDLDIVSGNVNYALDEIEEIKPRFIQIAERMGL